jgi:predicted DNA-binding protein
MVWKMANTQVRTFRIPEELWLRLNTQAEEYNVTKTSIVIDAMKYYLERVEK